MDDAGPPPERDPLPPPARDPMVDRSWTYWLRHQGGCGYLVIALLVLAAIAAALWAALG